ncbi:MAG: SDR family NAD(P)-dependent oxidoreductase [Myxococcales bacterium]|nr:SDR family NAD(P)-dependent oxidoreductase [Myxococcales bacterium]
MSDATVRNVVITGGAGALGSAVTDALVAAGMRVFVPLFEAERPAHLPAAVVAQTSVDLTSESAVEAYFQTIDGPLWASIHIAGGFAMSPLRETSLAAWNRMMGMNATSCFLCCREAARKMTSGGRIVNVAAKPALVPTGHMVAYSASKAAVASLTQSLAEELSADEIWVNAIVPSIMDTPANRAAMPSADHDAWPKVADIAQTIAFLASPENATTRGALVPVYGRS